MTGLRIMAYLKKSAEERKEELSAVMKQLEEGVTEIFKGDAFLSYLKTMSRFHRYSLNNQLLIHMQNPNATLVAGFNDWQKKFKRHVKKGEKAIRILAPCPVTYKKENEDGEEEERKKLFFKFASVFDVEQTEGEPLPTPAKISELTGEVENFDAIFEAVSDCTTATVLIDAVEGTAKGYYSLVENKIVVREGMDEVQQIKTLLHETTHSLLHNTEALKASKKDRETQEVEAEATAYVVCNFLGLDTSEYSFPYIGSWSSSRSVPELKASLEVIRKTSMQLIEEIEKKLNKDDNENEEEGNEYGAAV